MGGKRCSQVVLRAGLRVHLAPDLAIEVVDVRLPETALALEGTSLPRQVLGGVCSLSTRPAALYARFRPDADAWLWGEDSGWTVRIRGEEARPLAPGDSFVVDGDVFTAVEVPLAGSERTQRTAGLATPLRIVAHYDTVEVHPKGGSPVLINGIAARLVSELVAMDGPAGWSTVAREVWGDADDHRLRHRLDVTLSRLRSRLQKHGIRGDLVRTDGAGALSLLLGPADVVEDRT